MKSLVYLFATAILFTGCRTTPEKSPDQASNDPAGNEMKKIDIHAHFKQSRDYFPEFFEKHNLQAVLVDVAIADSIEVNRSWDEYVGMAKEYPELFWLCSSLIGDGIDDPDFTRRNIERLEREIDEGAKMVKVWKNFGMVTQDASGKFIQIDDPRLQPIWDFLKERNIPVIAHIGEPIQAWRPLDDPNNPHYGYYNRNPQYHAYQLPEIPKYETIMAARDHWIESNPDLRILCAHMGSMSHDVDMISERLDKFPNMYVETAARFGDLAGQESKKVRAFFEKYQDRIMFGTDNANNVPQNEMSANDTTQEKEELSNGYLTRWDYLGGGDSLNIRGQRTVGLNLPDSVLHKVYYQNAVDFVKL